MAPKTQLHAEHRGQARGGQKVHESLRSLNPSDRCVREADEDPELALTEIRGVTCTPNVFAKPA